ncbi:hypothetical protein FACS189479_09850 [Spirochaetia bacterium]|nr:hypothetical protein FACS189479_09850 [Spirochaetia bacterium]
MKIAQKTSSWIAAFLGWVLLSTLTVFVIWSLRDRARLIRDNDNERILNVLFTSQREFDDFGSAIEANPVLAERILGFTVYFLQDAGLEPNRQKGIFDLVGQGTRRGPQHHKIFLRRN